MSTKFAIAALLLSGCFSPRYHNGNLHCPAQECPSGFHCASDGTCWQNGSEPGASSDPGASPDGGVAGDAGGLGDGFIGDDGPPVDLAVGRLVYPPASVWIAGSGGSGSSSGAQLNLCSGGSIIVGGGASAGGGTVTFGYFSSGTN